MRKILSILVAVFLWGAQAIHAQDNLSALMPMPNSVEQIKGKPYRFVEGRTAISCTDSDQLFVAETLAGIIKHRTDLAVGIAADGTKGDITLSLDPTLPGDEHYRINVSRKGITLTGSTVAALHRATYMAFPRALALAEAGWTEMPRRSWESFKERLFPTLYDLMRSSVSVRVPYEIVER